MIDDELYHYGVKGMRWGVRRARSGGGGGGFFARRRARRAELRAARKQYRAAKRSNLGRANAGETGALLRRSSQISGSRKEYRNLKRSIKADIRDARRNSPTRDARREALKAAKMRRKAAKVMFKANVHGARRTQEVALNKVYNAYDAGRIRNRSNYRAQKRIIKQKYRRR